MVFFLTRSALCIGIVAAVASGGGAARLVTTIDHGARDSLEGAGRACLASSDCLRIGTAALSAATIPAVDDGARTPVAPPDEASRRAAVPRRSDARSIRRAIVAGE